MPKPIYTLDRHREAVIAMALRGDRIRDIAKAFSVSKSLVSKRLIAWIGPRQRGPRPLRDRREAF